MNPYEVIYRYYKKESRLCDILLRHSESVMRKALAKIEQLSGVENIAALIRVEE